MLSLAYIPPRAAVSWMSYDVNKEKRVGKSHTESWQVKYCVHSKEISYHNCLDNAENLGSES